MSNGEPPKCPLKAFCHCDKKCAWFSRYTNSCVLVEISNSLDELVSRT